MRLTLLNDGLPGMANQLWTASALVAYAAETGCTIKTPTLFRYGHYFECPPQVGWTASLRLLPAVWGWREYAYLSYALACSGVRKKSVIDVRSRFHLPPSRPVDEYNRLVLKKILSGNPSEWLLRGWMFRNPIGLLSHRNAVCAAFRPKAEHRIGAERIVTMLRKRVDYLVGVHWRQGDYRYWQGGKFWLDPELVRGYVHACRREVQSKGYSRVGFLLCSNGPVDLSALAGIDAELGPGSEIGDLHALSMCDMILGSNSTYGKWAAYYGGTEFYIMSPNAGAVQQVMRAEELAQ